MASPELYEEGSVFSVVSVEIADGRIQTVNSVVNPEKLTRLTSAP